MDLPPPWVQVSTSTNCLHSAQFSIHAPVTGARHTGNNSMCQVQFSILSTSHALSHLHGNRRVGTIIPILRVKHRVAKHLSQGHKQQVVGLEFKLSVSRACPLQHCGHISQGAHSPVEETNPNKMWGDTEEQAMLVIDHER